MEAHQEGRLKERPEPNKKRNGSRYTFIEPTGSIIGAARREVQQKYRVWRDYSEILPGKLRTLVVILRWRIRVAMGRLRSGHFALLAAFAFVVRSLFLFDFASPLREGVLILCHLHLSGSPSKSALALRRRRLHQCAKQ